MSGINPGTSQPDYQPMYTFSAADDAGRASEIAGAIQLLNKQVTALSPSKEFAGQYLALLSRCKQSVKELHWEEAQSTIWEATFLVNRAVETCRSQLTRVWLLLSPVATFIIILLSQLIILHSKLFPHSAYVYFSYLWFGAVGGTTIAYWGLIKHTIDLDFDDQYILWYILKPVLGAVMALISVIIVQGGMVTLGGSANFKNEFPLYIIAFLAGFSERFFIQLIDRVLTSLLSNGGTQKTAAALAAPQAQTAAPLQKPIISSSNI